MGMHLQRPRNLVLIASTLTLLVTPSVARAATPLDDDDNAHFTLSAAFGMRAEEGGSQSMGGMLFVELPIERWLRSSAPIAETPTARVEVPTEAVTDTVEVPVIVTTEVAKKAISAARNRALGRRTLSRLDDLASRARRSALLPELRLRLLHELDEEAKVSPTDSDPYRTSEAGGRSLGFEARATWQLDRLVFADEELPITRLALDTEAALRKVEQEVVAMLIEWQRAKTLEADGQRSAEEHRDDVLHVMALELSLDLATDGFFSRWRAAEAANEAANEAEKTEKK